MSKAKDTGVYQLKNGCWGFRYTYTVNGRKKDFKRTKDANGSPYKTKAAAIKAREAALKRDKAIRVDKPQVKQRVTIGEVYAIYCEQGRSGKAYATIRKQDSLWKNHLRDKFADRFIDEISVAEIEDYLNHLYYAEGYSFRYTESFLKMFYLIFGQAYSRDFLDVDIYNKLCVNKNTKINMPKIKSDEDMDITAFDTEQIQILDEYFRGTNAETAYILGCCCGLRINECYGLKWENINLDMGTITIDRQMQYQDGLIKLVPLKTHNSRRTVYLSERVIAYLSRLRREREEYSAAMYAKRQQNQTFIEDINGKTISSLELVNTLPNGKIQTVNSMVYHSKVIKTRYGIDFKFHNLRHTYGTRLAELNTPMHILSNQMGHGSGRVTQQYYLAVSKSGIDVLTQNLNAIQKT